jgi:O-antigen/teichoic acid export membrane protein
MAQLTEVLQDAPTGCTCAGWAEAWCHAASLLTPELARQFAEVMAPLDEALPTGWCHGDPWPANVVLDRRTTKVIDWENAVEDAPTGIDHLLIAMLHAVDARRATAAEAAVALMRGALAPEGRIAGRAWGQWDEPHRRALALAAFVLYLRNRSLFDMGAEHLRRELDTVVTALDHPDQQPLSQPDGGARDAGRAARGAGWLGLSAAVVKGAQTLVLLVLAGLLDPSALGVVAIATMITNIAQIMSDLGTGLALVYWRGDVRRAARSAVTVSVGMNTMVAATMWAVAPWLAQLLHASGSTWVIRGLVTVLPCYGAAAIPLELLRRDLAFFRRIVPDVVAAVVGAAAAVVLALHGHGIASLVAGQITQGIVTLLLAWSVGGVVVPGWNRDDVRGLIGYGGHLTLADLLQLGLVNADYVIVGRMLGGDRLGEYSLAYRLAYLPYLNVAFVIAGAAFPYLCRLPEGALGRAVERITSGALTLLAPLCIGIVLFADQLQLLGHKWAGAVSPTRWLAGYALLLSVAQLMQTAISAAGRPRTTMQLKLLHLAMLVPVLLLLVHRGITAVAIGQCLVVAVETSAAVAVARRHMPALRVMDLLRRAGPTAAAAACMAFAVTGAHVVFPGTVVSFTGLVAVGTAGLLAYLGALWVVSRTSPVRAARAALRPT